MRKSVLTLATATAFLLSSGMLANLRAQAGSQTNRTTTTTTTRDAQAPQAPTSETTTVQTTTEVNKEQTFMGKIDRKDDQFILEDKDKKASYKLDDATKADKFNGDNVKVTGTLDNSTNMIHVQTIEKVHD